MKRFRAVIFLVVFVVLASSVFARSGADEPVAYPDGYRSWTHIKSMVIEPGHPLEDPFQGIHHVYGNERALRGLESGTFADGSVLVFDLLSYTENGNAIHESGRKLIGVMKKDEDAFGDTGGWGFEAFAGNSTDKRLVDDGGKGCYACHASQKDRDFVFSRLRE